MADVREVGEMQLKSVRWRTRVGTGWHAHINQRQTLVLSTVTCLCKAPIFSVVMRHAWSLSADFTPPDALAHVDRSASLQQNKVHQVERVVY